MEMVLPFLAPLVVLQFIKVQFVSLPPLEMVFPLRLRLHCYCLTLGSGQVVHPGSPLDLIPSCFGFAGGTGDLYISDAIFGWRFCWRLIL